MKKNGWGGRDRTYASRSQSPLPYHLATPQRNDMVEGVGFEPTKAKPADLQSAPFDHFGIPPEMVDADGIEPPTPCL